MIREITCGICYAVTEGWTFMLPIRSGPRNPITIACEACALALELLCAKHRLPLQGYLDGTVACLQCIDEKTHAMNESKKSYIILMDSVLHRGEKEVIDALVADHAKFSGESFRVCKLRLLAQRSVRDGISVSQVIQNLRRVDSLMRFFGP